MGRNPNFHFSQGTKHLKEVLLKRSELFSGEFECLENPKDAFGARITAVPIENAIWLDHFFQNGRILDEFNMNVCGVQRKTNEGEQDLLYPSNFSHPHWLPILRAARAEPHHRSTSNIPDNNYREIHRDGLIEMGYVSCRSDSLPSLKGQVLFTDWLVVMFASAAVWVDRIRKQARAPEAGYVIEAEIRIIGDPVTLCDGYYTLGMLQPKLADFPRYSLGSSDETLDLLSLSHRDVWNCCGKDISDEENVLTIRGWTCQSAVASDQQPIA